jgi:hypothetical protein
MEFSVEICPTISESLVHRFTFLILLQGRNPSETATAHILYLNREQFMTA